MNRRELCIIEFQKNIEQTLNMLLNVPENQKSKTLYAIEQCKKCLASVPSTDTKVYIHIIGTDKSFKTSYLLDLFDHYDLRKLFSVKINNTSENTAVPCLVEPSETVNGITIRQLAISSGSIMKDNISQEMFASLYDLSEGALPDDYMLQVLIPATQTPMKLPVIEYPGIKEGADASEEQKKLHQTFQQNLIQNLIRFPGILVACFQHKVAIPPGHPMDIILKKYGEILPTVHKLPLIVSLQGASAITGYCGNTNVEKDIATDFISHKAFDTTIQLINPYNHTYPIIFGQPGPYVDSWIKNLSRYNDLNEIYQQIILDGGIRWSRYLLEDICTNSHIQEALDNIFLKPWVTKSESCIAKSNELLREIETYDEVGEIREKIRRVIISGKYRSIRTFFQNELAILGDGLIEDHQRFWSNIFYQYLLQVFDDNERCNAIGKILWKNLEQRLDPEHKGFLGTREEDLPYIIMNTAEMYVPNAIIRGDVDIFNISTGT